MFGVVVRFVGGTRAPVDEKLAKERTVLEPVVVHVDGFGALLFDGVVGESSAGGIIGLDGSDGLRMA